MPTRSLVFELVGRDRSLGRTFNQAGAQAGKFEKTLGRVGKGAAALFAGGVIVRGLQSTVRAAQEAAAVGRQTEAVIKSTGGAAGLSAKGFGQLATQISRTAAVDDDLIQAGENILATFTNIKASGPEKVFQRAEQAAVDMAAAMGHGEVTAEGLQTANVQLGKALNDPIKGMTALQKVGVTFSAQQKAQIAGFMRTGQVAKAQGVILAEVNKEFGGSAAASATSAKRFSVAVGNLQESIGGVLVPSLERGAAIAAKLAEGFTDLDKRTDGLASKALLGALALGGFGFAIGKTLKVVQESKAAWVALRVAKVANVAADAALITSEGGLAVATTVSMTAAERATAAFGALRATLLSTAVLGGAGLAGGIVAGFAAVGFALKKLDDHLTKSDLKKQISNLAGDPAALSKARTRLGEVNAQLAAMADGTLPRTFRAQQALREEQRRLTAELAGFDAADKAALPGLVAMGVAATDGADHFTRMAGAAKGAAGEVPKMSAAARDLAKALSTELRAGRDSILGVADAFDHGRRASAVAAKGILGDLRNEVTTLLEWAGDAQKLLAKGMDPAAVAFLSQKGPEYLHAFAVGSDKQIASFERLFKQRMAAATDVARATAEKGSLAWRDMVAKQNAETAKIKAAKARVEGVAAAVREMGRFRDQATAMIGGVRGKTVEVIARARIDKRELRAGLAAIASGHVGAAAKGMLVPGNHNRDDVLIRTTPGEAVVPKRLVPAIAPWLAAHGVPGFAAGGLVPRAAGRVGGLRPELQGEVNRVSGALAVGTLRAATAGVAKFLKGLSALGGGTGAGGWQWQIGVLRRAFPGLALISGFRPGARTHATGRQSYHALGRAVDVPPRMDVFDWIRSNYGARSKELIFSPAGGRQLKNGRPHMYSGVTRADHWDHAHWAFHQGGTLPEDVVGVGRSGATYSMQRGETVSPRGGGDIVININGPVYGDANALVAKVRTGIKEAQRRSGVPAARQLA